MALKEDNRFGKFEVALAALTIFLTMIGTTISFSFFCGSQLTEIVYSVNALKQQIGKTNEVLNQLNRQSASLRNDNTKLESGVNALDKRVDRIENRVIKLQDKIK